MIWTLELPGWIPTPLNKLLGHWAVRASRKKHDREVVGAAVMAYSKDTLRLLKPVGPLKRKIDLLIVWPKGKRSTDPDSLHKTVLDALKGTGAIYNDSARWCELGRVRYAKSPDDYCATIITITEI